MLRKIKFSDAERLNQINGEELGYPTSLTVTKKQLTRLIDDPKHFFLVYEDEVNKEMAGYVHAEVYESLYAEAIFNVLALAVTKKYQRQKIASQLMGGLAQEAKERAYPLIRLNSGEARTAAHKFYESVGYRSDKLQKRFLKKIR